MKNEEYKQIGENSFVFKPEKYPGPIAINVIPSPELIEYHKNAKIQINVYGKIYIEKIYK